jgi:hypothetical protein
LDRAGPRSEAERIEAFLQHARKAYPSLAAFLEPVPAISVITPPAATEQLVREAPGMNVIADGPCLLVVMGYRDQDGA